jgi:hypothetical protein
VCVCVCADVCVCMCVYVRVIVVGEAAHGWVTKAGINSKIGMSALGEAGCAAHT